MLHYQHFIVGKFCDNLISRFWKGEFISRLNVDVDMLNAVKSVLADVSSVSPSSEQRANATKG